MKPLISLLVLALCSCSKEDDKITQYNEAGDCFEALVGYVAFGHDQQKIEKMMEVAELARAKYLKLDKTMPLEFPERVERIAKWRIESELLLADTSAERSIKFAEYEPKATACAEKFNRVRTTS